MRVWEYKIYLARHLGLPMNELGRVPAYDFLAMVREVEYQRRLEQYPIIYRMGQLMCILTNNKTTKNKPEQLVGGEPKREARRMTKNKDTYEVLLGDGETYTLSILNANMMEALEDEYDKTWADLFKDARVKVIKSMLLQMLKPHYPDMNMERVGKLLTTKTLPAIVVIISSMSK